jgi:ketosteroid isomerase-like protein
LLADAENRIGRLIFRKEILMATKAVETKHQEIVRSYFSYIRELRTGKEEAVDNLIQLWDADGVFEFAGAPPLVATFQGRNAIHVLYKNRFLANGMPLQLDFKDKAKADVDVALGIVDTEVHRMREMNGSKVVAGWTTVIGTDNGQGFQVSGAHTFTFRDGKIRNLKVVISPQPEAAKTANLSADELAVDDIGRLSLAAWAVV